MNDTADKPTRPGAGPEESFGMQLHHVRLGLIRHFEQQLAASGLGLNFSQYRLLKVLSEADAMIASELARRLDYDPGALTRVLDRLQEQGLLRREHRQDDRRATDVLLTEAGHAMVAQTQHIAMRLNDIALSDLSAQEQTTLMSLLARVRATVESQ